MTTKFNQSDVTFIENNMAVIVSKTKNIGLPKSSIVKIEERMVLDFDGTREDRKRAFELNRYKIDGYSITITL